MLNLRNMSARRNGQRWRGSKLRLTCSDCCSGTASNTRFGVTPRRELLDGSAPLRRFGLRLFDGDRRCLWDRFLIFLRCRSDRFFLRKRIADVDREGMRIVLVEAPHAVPCGELLVLRT